MRLIEALDYSLEGVRWAITALWETTIISKVWSSRLWLDDNWSFSKNKNIIYLSILFLQATSVSLWLLCLAIYTSHILNKQFFLSEGRPLLSLNRSFRIIGRVLGFSIGWRHVFFWNSLLINLLIFWNIRYPVSLHFSRSIPVSWLGLLLSEFFKRSAHLKGIRIEGPMPIGITFLFVWRSFSMTSSISLCFNLLYNTSVVLKIHRLVNIPSRYLFARNLEFEINFIEKTILT